MQLDWRQLPQPWAIYPIGCVRREIGLFLKISTRMRGGKREGAGRPLAPPTALMRLRLPLPVYEAVQALGGDVWVKRVIIEALNSASSKAKN